MRKSAIALATGAVVLLAAAAVTRFVVLPELHQVPADYDGTSSYAGTLTMLNPAALASGDLANAFLTDVPVTVAQHVRTTSTAGSVAVMSNDVTVKGPDGTELVTSKHTYAVDRVTLEAQPAPVGVAVD